MKVVRLLVGLTVLTLASSNDGFACSCRSSGPLCQNAFQVDVVFAGTVRSIVVLPEDGPPLRPGEMRIPQTVRVEFDAVVPFRGLQVSNVTVLTAGSGPGCGYGFKPGERYLVHANRKGTELVTGMCGKQVAGTVGPFVIGGDVAPLRVCSRHSADSETCTSAASVGNRKGNASGRENEPANEQRIVRGGLVAV